MRVLAELLEPVEAETPYGGQVVSYEPLGSVWLRIDRLTRRERTEGGVSATVEVAVAETRVDPRLSEGRVLRFGGADRVIATVNSDPVRAGRVILNLERMR